MVQTQFPVGLNPITTAAASASGNSFTGGKPLYLIESNPFITFPPNPSWTYRFRHRWKPLIVSSSPYGSASADTMDGEQNHYSVLGLGRHANSADIKRAYRLLARKYHPDVSKKSQAAEIFKSIRHAYEVLSNETTRYQYDRRLKSQETNSRSNKDKWNYNTEFDDGIRIYGWAELREEMHRERYWKNYKVDEGIFNAEADERDWQESNRRGPFIEVLRSAFLSLFLFQTLGPRISLTFSSLMALFDRKLDAGYKIGYVTAWILGGRGGMMLTLCLSFASWVCGKTSSSVVALVVIAIWVCSNLARCAPLPQGVLLTLLYMSIKLQSD